MTATTGPSASTAPAAVALPEALQVLRPATEEPVERTAQWVRRVLDAGLLELPAWSSGDAGARLAALTALGRTDLDLARLAEGHVDAAAILGELGEPGEPGEPGDGQLTPGRLWGVWAANPPGSPVLAEPTDSGWLLTGSKPWCSGAGSCDRALVTATAPDGYRLFALDLSGRSGTVRVVPGSWPATAMRGSDSRTVELDRHPADAVGGPDDYLRRPGFWHGALGVAAVWLGGAQAVAARLAVAAERRPLDEHSLAHAGAVDTVLAACEALVAAAGAAVDQDPEDRGGSAQLWAARARAAAERAAAEVLDRVGRALGAAPLALDPRHGQLVADLGLYVRQSHAERDLAELGRLALAEEGRSWRP